MSAQPEGVRRALPSHARHVYMATYKIALKNKESIDENAELEADRLAWEAVKKKYQHAIHEWFPEGKA